MQNSQKTLPALKLAALCVCLSAVLTVVSGCHDADEHPSQMVKMREKQMSDQRKAMGGRPGGMAAPGAPQTTPSGQ